VIWDEKWEFELNQKQHMECTKNEQMETGNSKRNAPFQRMISPSLHPSTASFLGLVETRQAYRSTSLGSSCEFSKFWIVLVDGIYVFNKKSHSSKF